MHDPCRELAECEGEGERVRGASRLGQTPHPPWRRAPPLPTPPTMAEPVDRDMSWRADFHAWVSQNQPQPQPQQRPACLHVRLCVCVLLSHSQHVRCCCQGVLMPMQLSEPQAMPFSGRCVDFRVVVVSVSWFSALEAGWKLRIFHL